MYGLALALLLLLLPGVAEAQTQWQFSNLASPSACAGPVHSNIIGVDLGSNIFGVDGNVLNAFPPFGTLVVTGSTFNDRTYTVVAATLAPSPYPQGQTLVQVTPTIPSATGGFGVASSQEGTNCAGIPGGPVGAVQFNDTGAFGGTSAMLWNNSARTLSITPETSTMPPGPFGGQIPGILVNMSDYSTNNLNGIGVFIRQNTTAAGTRSKTGINVDSYQPPDNGGEVSGIYALQTGGGNAISLFKLSSTNTPAGQTSYPNNGFAMEIQSNDNTATILATSGLEVFGPGRSLGGSVMQLVVGASGTKGVTIEPAFDGGVRNFDAREAFTVGFNVFGGPSVNVHWQVLMNGNMGVGGPPDATSNLKVYDLVGGGNASVCVHADGRLYRGAPGC